MGDVCTINDSDGDGESGIEFRDARRKGVDEEDEEASNPGMSTAEELIESA